MMTKLDVYILTYNRAKYLSETIRSVLNQSYSEFTLYILDNCSTDDTPSVVTEFIDERLHYIRHEKNIGGIGNLNYALEHCKADYCVIFHDDDLMCEDFLMKEVEILESNEDIDIVSCNCFNIDENSNVIEKEYPICKDIFFTDFDKMLDDYLMFQKTLCFPTIMYRMKMVRDNMYRYDNNVGPCADVVFYWNVVADRGKILELGDRLVMYRTHCGQESSLSANSMILRLLEYMKRNERYSSYLNTHCNSQKIFFRHQIQLKQKLIEINHGIIDADAAMKYVEKLSKLLMHSKIDKIFAIILLKASKKIPGVVCNLYNRIRK